MNDNNYPLLFIIIDHHYAAIKYNRSIFEQSGTKMAGNYYPDSILHVVIKIPSNA